MEDAGSTPKGPIQLGVFPNCQNFGGSGVPKGPGQLGFSSNCQNFGNFGQNLGILGPEGTAVTNFRAL